MRLWHPFRFWLVVGPRPAPFCAASFALWRVSRGWCSLRSWSVVFPSIFSDQFCLFVLLVAPVCYASHLTRHSAFLAQEILTLATSSQFTSSSLLFYFLFFSLFSLSLFFLSFFIVLIFYLFLFFFTCFSCFFLFFELF